MTPHLECPHCQQTTWLRGDPDRSAACERCGTALGPPPRRLVAALRARFDRDARQNEGRRRFVRDRG